VIVDDYFITYPESPETIPNASRRVSNRTNIIGEEFRVNCAGDRAGNQNQSKHVLDTAYSKENINSVQPFVRQLQF